MAMRFYKVALTGGLQGSRDVRVPSLTDVQAADAAAQIALPGESIVSIEEVPDDGTQQADGPPVLNQSQIERPGMRDTPSGVSPPSGEVRLR